MAKKILFINQECLPYVPENDIATLGKEVPNKMIEHGCEIRTFMPKWGTINERRGQLHEVIRLSGMNITVNDTDHPLLIKVATIPQTRIQVYFIDNEEFFNRRQMSVDENGNEYIDNGERAIFYARGVLETVKKLRWTPDVIHIQGWIGAIIPLYLKKAYNDEPCFHDCKIVTSLFTKQLKTPLGHDFKKCIPFQDATAELLEPYGNDMTIIDLGKLAIDYSDAVIQANQEVNPTLLDYAQAKGMPILGYPGDDFSQKYFDFFEAL